MSRYRVDDQVVLRFNDAPYVDIIAAEKTWRGYRYVGIYTWEDVGTQLYVFYGWRVKALIHRVHLVDSRSAQ